MMDYDRCKYLVRALPRRMQKAAIQRLPSIAEKMMVGDEELIEVGQTTIDGAPGLCLVTSRRVMVLRGNPFESGVVEVAIEAQIADVGLPSSYRPAVEIRLRTEHGEVVIGFPVSSGGTDLILAIRRMQFTENPSLVPSDPDVRYLAGLVVLGGFGLGLEPGSSLGLTADADAIHLHVGDAARMRIDYAEVTSLQIGGPGAVSSGGGFVGGGFGLEGAATGILTATVLNALTTRTTITTLLYLQTTSAELIARYSAESPEQLRITLSPVFGRLRAAATDADVQTSTPVDPVATIRGFADLVTEGLLSQEEFETAKARILGTL